MSLCSLGLRGRAITDFNLKPVLKHLQTQRHQDANLQKRPRPEVPALTGWPSNERIHIFYPFSGLFIFTLNRPQKLFTSPENSILNNTRFQLINTH